MFGDRRGFKPAQLKTKQTNKIRPENQGKLVWLSGPPGAGKSTTGQLMSREAGFVYLEVDCIMNFLNPFVPTDVENPSVSGFRQKALKVNII